jgi:hypothetical protein
MKKKKKNLKTKKVNKITIIITGAIIIILIFGLKNIMNLIHAWWIWRKIPHEFSTNDFPTFTEWIQIITNLILSGLLVYLSFITYRMNKKNEERNRKENIRKEIHYLEKIYIEKIPIIINDLINIKENKDNNPFSIASRISSFYSLLKTLESQKFDYLYYEKSTFELLLKNYIKEIENNINGKTNKIIEIQKDYSMKIQNLLNTFRTDNLKS